jgi:hypothetical protein
MPTTPTRRDVLKTTASAAVVGGLATTPVTADPEGTFHVVEAGLQYDIPDMPNLNRVHTDSRPPYTVRESENTLLVARRAPDSLVDDAESKGALVAEQPTGPGQSRGLGPSESVGTLPEGLTSRMRSRGGVHLAESHRPPRVAVRWNGRTATVVVTGEPNHRIDPGTTSSVRLQTRTVEAETVRLLDERVDNEDIPEYRRAKKREYGTTEIDVTPVVKVTHHGELDAVRTKLA